MKLLYCIVVLGLIKCALTAVPVKPSQQQQQLIELYKQEVHKLERETFADYEKLFKFLLKGNTIKRSAAPIYQHFKQNIQLYLKKYPNASDAELTSIIVDAFIIFADIKKDKNRNYRLLSVYENGTARLSNNYMKSYVSMVKDKFIPKFEEYKKQLTPEELKQQQALMEWYKNLKNCSNFYCYSNYFNEFPLYNKTNKTLSIV